MARRFRTVFGCDTRSGRVTGFLPSATLLEFQIDAVHLPGSYLDLHNIEGTYEPNLISDLMLPEETDSTTHSTFCSISPLSLLSTFLRLHTHLSV